jgi:hypothetical protein
MANDADTKPRNDAFTGLLAISFLALVGGTVLMAMDADKLGKPPATKLQVDVPGVTMGKAGEPLRRPDTGKVRIDAAEPKPPEPMPGAEQSSNRVEPGKLPTLPIADVPGRTIPVKAEKPADPDGPPLPVKPFVPPK